MLLLKTYHYCHFLNMARDSANFADKASVIFTDNLFTQ